ncbi:hypothetical protein F0562_010890 [Nyssa sinensis]|uniref:ULTRAPETALA1/2 zinc finger domain-containing protein n=1 Tax=Nyssa sinensis TaxID=561372 RepID=A0A5J5A582_9ASTE|nr:hypothetical protein F0562_010890 [Nyssa sinensis]
MVNGEKVPLSKTSLLKYYNQTSKSANGSHRSHNGRVFHRDEFVRCARCNKERRFRLRTKEECRIYHDSLADVNWKCADMPYDRITCDDDEERASRRIAAARLASTSQGMQKLESSKKRSAFSAKFPIYWN